MIREAILLGNTARSPEEPRTDVKVKDLRTELARFALTLKNLGPYSFRVSQILDEGYDAALADFKKKVRKAATRFIKDAGTEEDSCLLFYYFGHGVKRDDGLYFVSKDSDPNDLSTLTPFHDFSNFIFRTEIPRVIFIIDCCHAGGANYVLRKMNGTGSAYYVLASTVAEGLAFVDGKNIPFGNFSRHLLEGLTHSEAANYPDKKVTVESWFNYASRRTQDEFHQIPTKLDEGLQNFVICEVEPQTEIDPEFNRGAHSRTFYRKIWWICQTIKMRGRITSPRLHKIIKEEKPVEMRMVFFNKKEGYQYDFVDGPTLEIYLKRLQRLDLISEQNSLSLTKSGEKLLSNNGKNFNSRLIDLIDEELKLRGSSVDDLDKFVRLAVGGRSLPTAAELQFDARRKSGLVIESGWFRILIDLLAQAGQFRYASSRTYFPR